MEDNMVFKEPRKTNNFVTIEEEILEIWDKEKIFQNH